MASLSANTAMSSLASDIQLLPITSVELVLTNFDHQTLYCLAQSCPEMQTLIDQCKLSILSRKSAAKHSPELHEFIMENFTVRTLADFWIVLRIVEFDDDYKEQVITAFGPGRIKACRMISEYDLLPHMFHYLCTEYGYRISIHHLYDRRVLANYRFMINNNIHEPEHTNNQTLYSSIITWAINWNRAYLEAIVHLIQSGMRTHAFMGLLRTIHDNRHSREFVHEAFARNRKVADILERVGFDIDRLLLTF